jgi:hypothetical protein
MTKLSKAFAALACASVSLFSSQAESSETGIYRPVQSISYTYGSKIAVGYFQQKEGTCAISLFLSENTGDDTISTPSRLRLKLAPAGNLALNSGQGQALELMCGAEAATLEVKPVTVPARFVSR